MAGVVAIIFFIVFRGIRKKFFGGAIEAGYRPSGRFSVVAGTLLAISIVGSVAQSYSLGKVKTEAAKAEAKRNEDAAKARAERQDKERQRLAAMSPDEREAEARRKEESVVAPMLQEGQKMLKRWREREAWATAFLAGKKLKEPDSNPVTKQEWDDVKARLNSIKETQPQYQKAQAMLKAMAEEDKKAAAAEAAFRAIARAEARKHFAKNLEQVFLEKRMDTDVSASGTKNTVLKIKWVLASRVTANDLSKSGILEQAENSGFKKVIFTDGYERQWWWDLKPKAD